MNWQGVGHGFAVALLVTNLASAQGAKPGVVEVKKAAGRAIPSDDQLRLILV